MRRDAEVWREGDVYVSYWPALDVYSQGDTKLEASAHLVEAIRLFIASCKERGTLDAVIAARGRHHDQSVCGLERRCGL